MVAVVALDGTSAGVRQRSALAELSCCFDLPPQGESPPSSKSMSAVESESDIRVMYKGWEALVSESLEWWVGTSEVDDRFRGAKL